MNAIRYWNQVSLDLVANDYTPDMPGTSPSDPKKPNQAGPTATSRALAMIHLAMQEVTAGIAANGITGYFSRIGAPILPPPSQTYSVPAAIGAAAANLCKHLYPAQKIFIDTEMARFGKTLASGFSVHQINEGEDYGRAAAAAMIALRKDDKSKADDTYSYAVAPGKHRADPHHPGQQSLGAHWGKVTPFAIAGPAAVNIGPPALDSAAYATAYHQVLNFGRDTSTVRSAEQTMIGIYWSYDGSSKLGTPPRLYNQIVGAISDAKNGGDLVKDAQLFALVNAGMADAGISAWHFKYKFNLWRPVVGIREADHGGPTGLSDGNAATKGDPGWCPLGGQDTNGTMQRNLTPNFPAFPSGHATFGSACFNLVAKFYGAANLKDIEFEFVSDEYNGISRDTFGAIRPRLVRKLNLKTANVENIESRVWLGVHWLFDGTEGDKLGAAIADQVFVKLV